MAVVPDDVCGAAYSASACMIKHNRYHAQVPLELSLKAERKGSKPCKADCMTVVPADACCGACSASVCNIRQSCR